MRGVWVFGWFWGFEFLFILLVRTWSLQNLLVERKKEEPKANPKPPETLIPPPKPICCGFATWKPAPGRFCAVLLGMVFLASPLVPAGSIGADMIAKGVRSCFTRLTVLRDNFRCSPQETRIQVFTCVTFPA